MTKVEHAAVKSNTFRNDRPGNPARISGVDVTTDRLTGRGGLSLFARYTEASGALDALSGQFADLRKNARGARVRSLFRQILCFLADGTERHLTRFDRLAADEGYAGAIETPAEAMVSSHQVKRFFASFDDQSCARFRTLLRRMAVERIRKADAEVIVLGLDSMVMDNNEAKQREGCEPTYKRKLGFHPLQLTWDRFIVDGLFRKGSVHCNKGDDAIAMIRAMVDAIRAAGITRPIVVRLDAGFHDQKLFWQLDDLGVGVLMGGRIYRRTRRLLGLVPQSCKGVYAKERDRTWVWRYTDFHQWKERRKAFLRVLYSHTEAREGQYELQLDEATESLIFSNLHEESAIGKELIEAGLDRYLDAEELLGCYHGRGSDELVHRHLKDFASEQLPFKGLTMNRAWYFVMLVAFFLFECFKEDVCAGVVVVGAYPNTVRRKVLDIAAKLVRGKNRLVLKVTAATWKALCFPALWVRANGPPPALV
jgi:hypothetical protein